MTRCNCSICRRYATLWAHATRDDLKILAGETATEAYVYGDKQLGFHRCARCGVVAYWLGHGDANPELVGRLAVNMNLVEPVSAIADLPIRNFDGADTWRFLD